MGSVIDRYDREASAYREYWAPVLLVASRQLLRELAADPARTILDVGTGVGSLLPELRAAFPAARVFGVDRSRGMLAQAPAGFPLAVMDAARLGVAARTIDLVFLAFILFHLESPPNALCEARRILRDQGRLGTITWGGELESPATRIWLECLDEYGATAADPTVETRHDRVDTPEKMKRLLSDAGFGSVRSWEGELSASIGTEQLIQMRTRLGSLRPRFDSLEPAVQQVLIKDARRRMEPLAAEDFTAVGKVIYAVAKV